MRMPIRKSRKYKRLGIHFRNPEIDLALVAVGLLLTGMLVVVGCGSDSPSGPKIPPSSTPAPTGPNVSQKPAPGSNPQGLYYGTNPPQQKPPLTATSSAAQANRTQVGQPLPELAPKSGKTSPALDGFWNTPCVQMTGRRADSTDQARQTFIEFNQGRIKLKQRSYSLYNCSDDFRSQTLELQGAVNADFQEADENGVEQGTLDISLYQLLLAFDNRDLADKAMADGGVCGILSWNPGFFMNVTGLFCPDARNPRFADPRLRTSFIDHFMYGTQVHPQSTIYSAKVTWQAPVIGPNGVQLDEITLSPLHVNLLQSKKYVRNGPIAPVKVAESMTLSRTTQPMQKSTPIKPAPPAPNQGNPFPPAPGPAPKTGP